MAEEGPGAPSVRTAQQRAAQQLYARAKENGRALVRTPRAWPGAPRAAWRVGARAPHHAATGTHLAVARWAARRSDVLSNQAACTSGMTALHPFLSQHTFAGTNSPSRSGRALRLSRLGGALSGKLESGGRTTRTHSVATWLHGRRPSHYRPLSNGPAHHPSARSFSSASLASALSRFLCARSRVQSGLCRS